MFNSVNYNSIELNTNNHDEIAYFKSVSDTITSIEIINKKVIKKSVADITSATDTIIKSVGKMISDIITSVAIANKNTIKKFVNDTISHTDSPMKHVTRILTLDVMSASDSLSKTVGKMANELITNIDSITTDALRSFRKPVTYLRRSYNNSSIHRAVKTVTKIIR